MNFAVTTNILTMMLCIAVLVQSLRMMRSLRKVKDGALTDTVKALDVATVQARAVLSDMKRTLSGDCAENARIVNEARALREELSVMIGIAESAAGRIRGAVGAANAREAKPAREARQAKAAPRTASRPARTKPAEAKPEVPRAPEKPAAKSTAKPAAKTARQAAEKPATKTRARRSTKQSREEEALVSALVAAVSAEAGARAA